MSKNNVQILYPNGAQATCVYCGVKLATTVDEVIPRALFRNAAPKEGYIKVPACSKCNNEKSKGDFTLIQLTSFDKDAVNHSQPKTLMKEVIKPSMLHRGPEKMTPIEWAVFHNSCPVNLVTKSGIFTGRGQQIGLDREKIEKIFFRISQGLHYYFFKTYLKPDLEVFAHQMDVTETKNFLEDIKPFPNIKKYTTHNLIFNCLFYHEETMPGFSFAILEFHIGVHYAVVTIPPELKSTFEFTNNKTN